MQPLKTVFALVLGASLVLPAAAQEQDNEQNTVEPVVQLFYEDELDGGRFVTYNLFADQNGNWALQSQFIAAGQDGQPYTGGFDMGHGSALTISDKPDAELLKSLSPQCSPELNNLTADAGTDATYYIGQDGQNSNRIRFIVKNDDQNWSLQSLLKEPNKAGKCIEGRVAEKPQETKTIPGTNIPFPKGPGLEA